MIDFLRKDLLLIVGVAALCLSLSYAIGYVSERPAKSVELQTNFLSNEVTPIAQSTVGRTWRQFNFEKANAVGSTSVKEPTLMRVDESGNIYVLDWSDLRIKEFSPEGKLFKTFGGEKGTNDAFVNPTGFSIGPAGEIWVCDPRQQRIKGFYADGNTQTVTPRSAIDRVAALGDALITMAPPGNNKLFEVYDLSGKWLRSFGEFVKDQSETGIVLDGSIIGDTENRGFIYGGRYTGLIAAYDADGKQRFIVQTIDGVTLPSILDVEGRRKPNPNATQSVLSMSIVGNALYVLSGVRADGTGRPGGRVLDVYDKRDGHYLFSLNLPVACWEAVVGPNYIYTLDNHEVAVWRFRQNAS